MFGWGVGEPRNTFCDPLQKILSRGNFVIFYLSSLLRLFYNDMKMCGLVGRQDGERNKCCGEMASHGIKGAVAMERHKKSFNYITILLSSTHEYFF